MDMILFIFVGVVLGIAVALVLDRMKPRQSEGGVFLQNQLNELSRIVDAKLSSIEGRVGESSASLLDATQRQAGETVRIVRDLSEKLVRLDETNKQVVDFSSSLKNLEAVLTNQKKRGSLGEAGLELILQNMLPPTAYAMQYQFKNGEAVDAAIFVKEKILPIDAKFSLDNYRRLIDETDTVKREQLEKDFKTDLKKRIEETAKYIRIEENTLDFAFMFIPAEGIYYDLLVNEVGAVKSNTSSLIEYAFREKKVIIVSPTTFAAYLQTVMQGLRALQIEESVGQIVKRVGELQRHIVAFDEYMEKLGNAMGTSVNHYNTAYKELKKIDKDIVRIGVDSPGVEPLTLDKPTLDV